MKFSNLLSALRNAPRPTQLTFCASPLSSCLTATTSPLTTTPLLVMKSLTVVLRFCAPIYDELPSSAQQYYQQIVDHYNLEDF